jgi:hypothetical protein
MAQFNENHPEKRPDETFVTNASIDGFNKNIFKTKRLGLVAYTVYGDNMNSKMLFPLFASSKEVENVIKEQGCTELRQVNFYKTNSKF